MRNVNVTRSVVQINCKQNHRKKHISSYPITKIFSVTPNKILKTLLPKTQNVGPALLLKFGYFFNERTCDLPKITFGLVDLRTFWNKFRNSNYQKVGETALAATQSMT